MVQKPAKMHVLGQAWARYRGLTREAYTLDLRQFTAWCRTHTLNLFAVRRADIESFARDLEARGRALAMVTRRLCTIAGFYRHAVEEELLDHSPAAHVRRPAAGLRVSRHRPDRNELGAMLVATGLTRSRWVWGRLNTLAPISGSQGLCRICDRQLLTAWFCHWCRS
jgi:site-specific recombinase XerD